MRHHKMMWTRKYVTISLLLAICWQTQGARILGVFPFPAPSHLIVMKSLAKELARQGHEVTVLTPLLEPKLIPNYKEIELKLKERGPEEEMNMFAMREFTSVDIQLLLWGMGSTVCEASLSQPSVQALIHSKEKFDLIIVETFCNECFHGFSHTFQAPLIQVCPFGGAEWMMNTVGNPNPYSYVPDFGLAYNDHMNFYERFHNTLVSVFRKIGREVYFLPMMNRLMQKYFNGTGPGPIPYISEIDTKTSLVLLNTHVSISNPRPLMPNAVEVGGMHIKPPQKLPQDLQKFLDEAKEGVVYFSMGSNLKSAEMPAEKRDALLKAFGKLKQKVLWKWESISLPGQPKNVKLGKWLPQSDLLAHPNIKVFITHGGLLSIQEALYHGVPIIGIPIFGDQPMNMKRAVIAEYAVHLDFNDITEETVSAALDEILNNAKYTENAKRLSRTFRDQPRTPMETAVFWVEYVLRHQGAYHMRSASMELNWFQYHLLDVLAVLAGAALACLMFVYLLLRTVYRCICPSKKSKRVTDSKKKK